MVAFSSDVCPKYTSSEIRPGSDGRLKGRAQMPLEAFRSEIARRINNQIHSVVQVRPYPRPHGTQTPQTWLREQSPGWLTDTVHCFHGLWSPGQRSHIQKAARGPAGLVWATRGGRNKNRKPWESKTWQHAGQQSGQVGSSSITTSLLFMEFTLWLQLETLMTLARLWYKNQTGKKHLSYHTSFPSPFSNYLSFWPPLRTKSSVIQCVHSPNTSQRERFWKFVDTILAFWQHLKTLYYK